jgi:ABC-type Fe3+ transport system substrate-binding protein
VPRSALTALLLAAVVAVGGCRNPVTDELPPLDEETPTPEPRRPAVTGAATVRALLSGPADWSGVRDRNPNLSLTVTTTTDGPADLIVFGSVDAARRAHAAGRFIDLPSDLLEKAPPPFRGPGGGYLAVSLRAHVIAARRLMANRPLSILGLAESRWRGKVARTAATEPDFVDLISIELVDHGVGKTGRFLGGLRVGTAEKTRNGSQALESVAARRTSLALIQHVDFHRFVFPTFDPAMNPVAAQSAVAETSTELLYPDRGGSGVPWSATIAAVPRDASNPEAAFAVLDSLLSAGGRETFAWSLREYPVAAGAPGPPGTLDVEQFEWSSAGFESRDEVLEDSVDLAQQVEAAAVEPPSRSPEAPSSPTE